MGRTTVLGIMHYNLYTRPHFAHRLVDSMCISYFISEVFMAMPRSLDVGLDVLHRFAYRAALRTILGGTLNKKRCVHACKSMHTEHDGEPSVSTADLINGIDEHTGCSGMIMA